MKKRNPKIKIIATAAEHREALKTIEDLWDALPGSQGHDLLGVLALLVEDYERRTFPIEDPDPIEAIKFRLDQMGKDVTYLQEVLHCSRTRVWEILKHQRGLSLAMIRRLHDEMHIPLEALIPRSEEGADAR
jgi:HTH-type transcriptional regulator / antitoxin HigA